MDYRVLYLILYEEMTDIGVSYFCMRKMIY